MPSAIEQQHHQPSEIILQVDLWTTANDMLHCLLFVTRTHVSHCRAPLLVAGCAVTFISPEAVIVSSNVMAG